MKEDTTHYWLISILYTLFSAIFMMVYQQRDVIAEDSIFIEVKNNRPTCQVLLYADGVIVGTATMDNGGCNINLYNE